MKSGQTQGQQGTPSARNKRMVQKPTCVDVPNFLDPNKDTCEEIEKQGQCKDGKIGDPNGLPAIEMDCNDDGVCSRAACCACGGGQGKGAKQQEKKVTCVIAVEH